MSVPLSDRVRPNSEAAAWVCDEIKRLERKLAETQSVARAALEWIDAVPADTVLPAMPGFDRDWAEGVLGRGHTPSELVSTLEFYAVNVGRCNLTTPRRRRPQQTSERRRGQSRSNAG